MGHPRHRIKTFDRLLAPGATPQEIAADYATKPFDLVARQMEARWGIDRLIELQDPAIAQKFGQRIAELNEALNAGNPEEAARISAICIANLRRMDELATAAGHQPMPPEVWEIDLDGERVTILRDGNLWPVLRAIRGDDAKFYTLREIAVALRDLKQGGWIDRIKANFPGAEMTAIRRREPETEIEKSLDDVIPW